MPNRLKISIPWCAFLAWTAVFLLIYVSPFLDARLNLSLALVPTIAMVAIIAVVIWLVSSVIQVCKKNWVMVVITMASPALPWLLYHQLMRHDLDIDWLRFTIDESRFEQQTTDLKRVGCVPGHYEWHWGETGAASGPNIFSKLVYDSKDRPTACIEPEDDQQRTITIRPMGNHFFIVKEIYP